MDVSGSVWNPYTTKLRPGTEKSIVSSVINRIGIDVAAINIQHVKKDQNGRYLKQIKSGLNHCLTVEANIDQTARAFIQDATMRLCDEGIIAIVPVDLGESPDASTTLDIRTMRLGSITQWYPDAVTVKLYNDKTGNKQEITLPKRIVGIIENPLYSVMNEPNSTLKRLIRKLNILDAIDEQSGSGKLDLIVQLPYLIRSDARKAQAELRRADLEKQLAGSKYGVAYTDGTEKITQLNRPVENNLLNQITYLTDMLYSQLGITKEVMEGVADESTMLNYYNRTIEPILSSITNELERKFLTKTARSQGQAIMFFRDPFRLVPAEKLADICDKLTRNEILSSNEVRALIGYKPVDDARADELRNKNLNQEKNPGDPVTTAENNDNSEEDANSDDASLDVEHVDKVNNFLEHHGIKGQKWGVRNGPPYPIGEGRKQASKLIVGYEPLKYKSKTGRVLKDFGIAMARQTAAMLIPGAATAMNAKSIADFTKHNLDSKDYVKKQGDFEKIKDIPKIPKDAQSIKTDLKVVNPSSGSGRVNNCAYCVAAFEMRQRGYDVEARRKSEGTLAEKYKDWFDGVEFKTSGIKREAGESRKDWVTKNYNNLCENLEKYGKNARGYIGFNWEKAKAGHTLSWMNDSNGKVTFYDAQSGKVNDWNTFSFTSQVYTYGRLDNLKLKSEVTEACISRGGTKK